MNKLTAADLMIICDTLNHSLSIVNYGTFTKETREFTMQRVLDIMENMNAKVVCDEVGPEWNETGDGV